MFNYPFFRNQNIYLEVEGKNVGPPSSSGGLPVCQMGTQWMYLSPRLIPAAIL